MKQLSLRRAQKKKKEFRAQMKSRYREATAADLELFYPSLDG
jgi:hypothetical protein